MVCLVDGQGLKEFGVQVVAVDELNFKFFDGLAVVVFQLRGLGGIFRRRVKIEA